MKKIMLLVVSVTTAVVVILLSTVAITWDKEIKSVMSITQLLDKNDEQRSAPVYEMQVYGNYYFDEFIDQGGVSDDGELIDFVVDNITKGLIPIDMSAPEIGCSAFTAINENDERLFGRNYDFSTSTAMILKTNPTDGRYSSISSVDLQFLGINDGSYLDGFMDEVICLAAAYAPLDGINEKGVACGIFMSYQGEENAVVATNQDTDKPDLTSTTMLRMILDYAGSVDEAVELVSQYDLHDSAGTSFHYMVADSTGKSAILEWVDGTDITDNDGSTRVLKVTYNDDDDNVGVSEAANDFQYITNFIIEPNYYDTDESKKGLDRYLEIENMINPDGTNTSGVITNELALKILQQVGRRNWDLVTEADDANGITVWSALYNLSDKSVIWVSNEEFDNPNAIFEYSL